MATLVAVAFAVLAYSSVQAAPTAEKIPAGHAFVPYHFDHRPESAPENKLGYSGSPEGSGSSSSSSSSSSEEGQNHGGRPHSATGSADEGAHALPFGEPLGPHDFHGGHFKPQGPHGPQGHYGGKDEFSKAFGHVVLGKILRGKPVKVSLKRKSKLKFEQKEQRGPSHMEYGKPHGKPSKPHHPRPGSQHVRPLGPSSLDKPESPLVFSIPLHMFPPVSVIAPMELPPPPIGLNESPPPAGSDTPLSSPQPSGPPSQPSNSHESFSAVSTSPAPPPTFRSQGSTPVSSPGKPAAPPLPTRAPPPAEADRVETKAQNLATQTSPVTVPSMSLKPSSSRAPKAAGGRPSDSNAAPIW